MEELGYWRHYVWWAGLLVAVATSAYTGSHRFAKPSPWLFGLSSVSSMTLASIAILPARISPRRKAMRLAITAALYAVLGGIVYLFQDPSDGGWGAIGG